MSRSLEQTGGGVLEVGVAGAGGLRWVAADLTPVAETARRRLDCSPLAAAALGRSLTAAALLLRLAVKTPARLLLHLRGDGPLGRVVAEADADGNLRGMVGQPLASLPPGLDGRPAVGEGIGSGRLEVSRAYASGGFHTSQVELVSGEVGRDVAHYLAASEQVRSAVLVGVLTERAGVGAAGGVIVEALPEADEEAVARLEDNIDGLGEGVSRLLSEHGLSGLRERLFQGLSHRPLETRLLRYRCRCSSAAVAAVIVALEPGERASLRRPDGRLEAECSFCGRRYRFAD